MNSRSQYLAIVVLASLTLVLSLMNIVVVHGNRSLDRAIRDQQPQVNQAVTMNRLNQDLVQAIAGYVVNDKDDAMKKLLDSQNITITTTEKTPATADQDKK